MSTAKKKADKQPKQKREKAIKPPSYLAKIDRLQAALPPATDLVASLANSATAMSDAELASLAARVSFEQRRRGIVGAAANLAANPLAEGETVRIVRGPNRHVGAVGTVTMVRRIRCFVEVPGSEAPVYLFTSDVERISGELPATLAPESANILDVADEANQEEEELDEAAGG